MRKFSPDVVFKFNLANDRPYELHFTVKAGVSFAEPLILTYGDPELNHKGFNSVHTECIAERGGLTAWIEMTRGSARIYIQYTS